MEELYDYRVPQNLQAEQSVIGSMLIDSACIPDVLKDTTPGIFFEKQHRDIYETISFMAANGKIIDPVTILEEMKVKGVARDSSKDYFIELMRITPTAANVQSYIEILKEKALLRSLAAVSSEITRMISDGTGNAADMLEKAERGIYGLRKDQNSGGLKPISETMVSVLDEMNQLSEKGGRIPGIPTGLIDLDNRILGLNPGELILIASRPGMGKTSIALNIAMNAAKVSEKTVVIFSLEMSREQLTTRMLSAQSLVDSQKLLRGNIDPEEWRRINAAAVEIGNFPIMIDDNPMVSVSDISAQCRRIDNLGLVVIDYLQLMVSAGDKQSRAENRQQQVADISRMLKIMAKDLKVPVLCMSQLSRASETRQDKRPMLSDLRESGAIEQDADVVIGLYREGYYEREKDPKEKKPTEPAEAIVLKNRKGQIGTVPLLWLADYTMYVSADTRH